VGKCYRRVDGKPQRRAAEDVEWEMSADVDPGQAHGRDGDYGEETADWPEMGKGGRAESDSNTGVSGQVPEPGGVGAAAVGTWQQAGRPRSAHHLLDELGQRPGAGACGKEPARQSAFSGKPRHASSHGRRANGTELHGGPGGQVNRVGQAVDRAERHDLNGADARAARRLGRDQYDRRSCTEADPGIG
jgi:hypothetical protein